MRIPTRRNDFKGYAQDPHMTQSKFNELHDKLERLKKVTRLRLMKEVATHAENGDFSENAAYQIAKGKLRGVNDAIHYLEEHLKKAIIISKNNSGRIDIGSTVTVEVNGKEKTFTILGSSEVDLSQNIISHSSPIGAALLGKGAGESVIILANDRKVIYKIIEVK